MEDLVEELGSTPHIKSDVAPNDSPPPSMPCLHSSIIFYTKISEGGVIKMLNLSKEQVLEILKARGIDIHGLTSNPVIYEKACTISI